MPPQACTNRSSEHWTTCRRRMQNAISPPLPIRLPKRLAASFRQALPGSFPGSWARAEPYEIQERIRSARKQTSRIRRTRCCAWRRNQQRKRPPQQLGMQRRGRRKIVLKVAIPSSPAGISKTWVINAIAKMACTCSPPCSNNWGPGVMLYIIMAPSTIAVTASPGTPKTNAGIQAPATAALRP